MTATITIPAPDSETRGDRFRIATWNTGIVTKRDGDWETTIEVATFYLKPRLRFVTYLGRVDYQDTVRSFLPFANVTLGRWAVTRYSDKALRDLHTSALRDLHLYIAASPDPLAREMWRAVETRTPFIDPAKVPWWA